jgi:hypothetical protein
MVATYNSVLLTQAVEVVYQIAVVTAVTIVGMTVETIAEVTVAQEISQQVILV